MNTISKNIKTLREEKSLSQKELATLLNVSPKTVSHWESGYTEPCLSVIKQLKIIFEVDYQDLLD